MKHVAPFMNYESRSAEIKGAVKQLKRGEQFWVSCVFQGFFEATLIELRIIAALKMTPSGGYSPLSLLLLFAIPTTQSEINYGSCVLDEYATCMGNVFCVTKI